MLVFVVLALVSLGGIGATAGAGAILFLGYCKLERLTLWPVSFAIGTLLSSALLGLLPETLNLTEPTVVMPSFLVGLVGFFLLERLVIWRCRHDPW